MQVASSLRSPLLPTEAYRFALAERLRAAEKNCLVISAYLTVGGLEWISKSLPPGIQVSILTRWKASDLVSGASDIASFWFAQSRDWDFRILHELHAKCCLVDDDTIFVGSANVTNKGFCLTPGGNRELGLFAQAFPEDVQTSWSLHRCGVIVTSDIAKQMESWVKETAASTEPPLDVQWPSDIDSFLAKKLSGVWVADLPWAPAQNVLSYLGGAQLPDKELEDVRHDLSVFSATTPEHLAYGFRQSNCFRWLINFLSKDPAEPFAYYGRLTEGLHNSLLDDPRPYRKDIKTLLSNVISYTIAFAGDTIAHDRPNYSERLALRR